MSQTRAAFLRDGYAIVPGAVPQDKLSKAQLLLWSSLERDEGVNKDIDNRWKEPSYRLRPHHYNANGSVDILNESLGGALLSSALVSAVATICGSLERIDVSFIGSFNNFIARKRPSSVSLSARIMLPAAMSPTWRSWHIDGWQSPRDLTSPDIGLVCFWLLSDVDPWSGGTVIDPDSIGPVARLLHSHGSDGIDPTKLHGDDSGRAGYIKPLLRQTNRWKRRELIGEAGDVFLCHSLLLHAGVTNATRHPRLLARSFVRLKQPMCVEGYDGLLSPVESLIKQSIRYFFFFLGLNFEN